MAGDEREAEQLIADLAEDLAIELLAEFEEEDYIHLEHSIEKLLRAQAYLTMKAFHVPLTVEQVIRNYKRKAN